MTAQPPPNFLDLYTSTQEERKTVNVIGVITDVLPPRQTKGSDQMLTFSIDDGTIPNAYNGQKIRLFGRERTFPPIKGNGDVMILRSLKCMTYSGQTILISSVDTKWTLFHGPIPRKMPDFEAPLKNIKSPTAPKPTKSEMEYVISLSHNQDKSKFAAPLSQEVKEKLAAPKQKFSLIRDAAVNSFHDFVGEVIKVFPNRPRADLYITDYTEHGCLYSYGENDDKPSEAYTSPEDEKKWLGPPGKYTLQVDLGVPHSHWTVENVKPGDFVEVRNVRVKLNHNESGTIEGSLWGDKVNTDRVNVKLLEAKTDKRVQGLLERKQQLGFGHILNNREAEENGNDKKRKSEADDLPDPKRLKKQRRKAKSKEKKKQVKEQQNLSKQQAPQHPANPTTTTIPKPLTEPNKNIRCSNLNIPYRTVPEVLSSSLKDSPSSSADAFTSLTTVRVVDFKPSALENFAVLISPPPPSSSSHSSSYNSARSSPYNSDSDHSATSLAARRSRAPRSSNSNSTSTQFEWRFALLLEDANSNPSPSQSLPPSPSPSSLSPPLSPSPTSSSEKKPKPERMIVWVQGADAEYLLNASAKDLRADAQALARLRETMFLLWGDLEERKGMKEKEKGKEVLREGDGNRNGGLSGSGSGSSGGNGKDGRAEGGRKEEDVVATRPFTCCIKEYGVERMDGVWERRFGICDTKIMQGSEDLGMRKEGVVVDGKVKLRAPIAG